MRNTVLMMALVALCAVPASGQVSGFGGCRWPVPCHSGLVRQARASTVTESHLLGVADYIRAMAQARLLNAEVYARICQLNQQRLANRQPGVSARFAGQQGGLDVTTGLVSWPVALREPAFAARRAVVEQVLFIQATQGAVTRYDHNRAVRATREMLNQLRRNRLGMSRTDYAQGHVFLETMLRLADTTVG